LVSRVFGAWGRGSAVWCCCFGERPRASSPRPFRPLDTPSHPHPHPPKPPKQQLDLYAPWCGKCRMISPLVEELAAKHAAEIDFVKLDTTAEPVEAIAAQELGVKALPAFHFYGGDGKPALPAVTGYKRRPLEEAVAALVEATTTGGGK
jgi:thioredoxin 1